MRKLFLTGAIITLLLTGCSSDDTDTTTTKATTETVTEVATEATTEANTEATTEAAREKSFTDLQNYLMEEGVISGSSSESLFQYIGAIDGIKYQDNDIELYEYDMSSDTYQTIVSTMEVSGIPVAAVNGPYVLIISNNGSNPTAVEAFNAY